MPATLSLVTLVVGDYDAALDWYRDVLGFQVVEDSDLGGGRRWVVVRPPESGGGAALLLARAATPDQAARIGDQTGGRVGFFLTTDDFARDHAAFAARGVTFLETPRREAYGMVAKFQDLYGNRWDLIEPAG